MIRILPDQVTPAIRSLFRVDDMAASRCFVVLDGKVSQGKIIVDHLADPKWAVVQEAIDYATFLGGQIDRAAFLKVFSALRQEGDVLIGMLPEDPRIAYLPPDPDYDGRTLEFYDRPIGEGLDQYIRQVPADCTLRRLDRELILRTEWGPNDVKFYGGLEAWEKSCFGYCLMRGDQILSEATVGPTASGCLAEPGVFTQEAHRGSGYGTMVAARLIQEIEAMGGNTYWNCAKQNLASAAIARKLGYRMEKEFRCMDWNKVDGREAVVEDPSAGSLPQRVL